MKKVYKQLGKDSKALEIVNQLLELEPDNNELIDERLSLLKSTGGIDAVKKELEEKSLQFPDDLSYKWELVQIYEDENEYKKALGMLDMINNLVKDNVDVLERMLKIFWDHQQDGVNSVIVLKELIKLKPKDPGYVTRIALISYENGNYKKAVSETERALSIDRSFCETVFIKAKAINDFTDIVVRGNNGEIRYQDKLVYQLVYDLYIEAAKDPVQKGQGRQIYRFSETVYTH